MPTASTYDANEQRLNVLLEVLLDIRDLLGKAEGPSEAQMRQAELYRPLLSRSVDEMELSVRAANILQGAEIKTIGQLVEVSPRRLMLLPHCGRHVVADIHTELGRLGLKLADDPPKRPKPGARS
jgi:DNA-directed RNA polymerase subunit alpha